jgi:hypothetical protein
VRDERRRADRTARRRFHRHSGRLPLPGGAGSGVATRAIDCPAADRRNRSKPEECRPGERRRECDPGEPGPSRGRLRGNLRSRRPVAVRCGTGADCGGSHAVAAGCAPPPSMMGLPAGMTGDSQACPSTRPQSRRKAGGRRRRPGTQDPVSARVRVPYHPNVRDDDPAQSLANLVAVPYYVNRSASRVQRAERTHE